MLKRVKAVCTIVAGTIGVGFLALPYSIYRFGTFGGVAVLIIVGFLIFVTNVAYADVITFDKGNKQIPGYVKKYLGCVPAHFIAIVMICGSFGTLLAYGIIAGDVMGAVFTSLGIDISRILLRLAFTAFALLLAKYKVQVIVKVSSFAAVVLIGVIFLFLSELMPNIDCSNVTALDMKAFPMIFGISVFAMFSAVSIPVIDEVIGYSRSEYRRVILIANSLTLFIYIVFGLILSLSLGSSISSELVDTIRMDRAFLLPILSVVILLAVFTSFVLIANSIKEVFSYDYKVPAEISMLIIAFVIVPFIVLQGFNFEILLSIVGGISLVLQSLAIIAVWFKIEQRANIFYKGMVGVCGLILIVGMLSQLVLGA